MESVRVLPDGEVSRVLSRVMMKPMVKIARKSVVVIIMDFVPSKSAQISAIHFFSHSEREKT